MVANCNKWLQMTKLTQTIQMNAKWEISWHKSKMADAWDVRRQTICNVMRDTISFYILYLCTIWSESIYQLKLWVSRVWVNFRIIPRYIEMFGASIKFEVNMLSPSQTRGYDRTSLCLKIVGSRRQVARQHTIFGDRVLSWVAERFLNMSQRGFWTCSKTWLRS